MYIWYSSTKKIQVLMLEEFIRSSHAPQKNCISSIAAKAVPGYHDASVHAYKAKILCMYALMPWSLYLFIGASLSDRSASVMLENLPKILLGISQKFPYYAWTLSYARLCSIMLTIITAVSYVYTHNYLY